MITPLFSNPPHFIDFFESPHVAHFAKVISPFVKGWVESMDISIYLFLQFAIYQKDCNIVAR